MKDICIPIPKFEENQIAEVEVTVNGKKRKFNYRIDSFAWAPDDKNGENVDISVVEAKITKLKNSIESYDSKWQLVQIYTPTPGSEYIQVLFRQISE
ncbi:MAG: hypothetical protein KKA84_07275 [Bacteroidetes bacterium]|nr:hypothetical protein [Bacteroidota bacterium]